MKTRCLWLVISLFIVSGALAQEAPITIQTGRLIDGAGNVQEDVTITVTGSRITGVSVGASDDAATYNLSELTLMPGLIDTHVHLTAHFDADGRNHSDPDETPTQAILFAAENAYATLMAGFTTVQSLGSPRDRDARGCLSKQRMPGTGQPRNS